MNTRRNNAPSSDEENVNEVVRSQDPQNPNVFIEEGSMSDIEISATIHSLT